MSAFQIISPTPFGFHVFCAVYCNVIMQYKIKIHNSLMNILILSFLISSTCFETERSSSARRSYIQVWYRGADKFLARPGRKQARKHVRDARDFDNIETRAVINIFSLQGKAPKEIHAILTELLACFLLVRLRTYQRPCMVCFTCISINRYVGRSVCFRFWGLRFGFPSSKFSPSETTTLNFQQQYCDH